MFSGLFKRSSKRSRSTFSSIDQEELEFLIDSHGPPGGVARFTGLVTGLIATRNAPTTEVLTLPSSHVRQMVRRRLAFSPVPISGAGFPDTAELGRTRRLETRLLKSPDLGDVLLALSETVNFLLGAYSDTGSGAGADPAFGTIRRSEPKTGPNQPCLCGSGKKYKKCHGAPGRT